MTERRSWIGFAAGVGLLGLLLPAAGVARTQGVPEEWRTPAERAVYEATPSLDETRAFLERIAARLPEMRLATFGTSAAGRPLLVAIVSKAGAFTPEAARATGRPVVLVVNGIHAGEIDGKDACLELLRDWALGRRRELLDAGTLLVVPAYNADGHERVSPWNRPNQSGPVRGMGFRATVDGHDLNRDWLKGETPEARAMIGLVRDWDPHLAIDDHVTNGVDHDWTVTWSRPEPPQTTPALAGWTARAIEAGAATALAAGFSSGPYLEPIAELEPERGYVTQAYGPRYSTGYFALRNRATILVETHSHKPYERRVAGNREFLAGVLGELVRTGGELVAATAAADREAAAARELVLDWETAEVGAERRSFPIYVWTVAESAATGEPFLSYERGRVRGIEAPWQHGSRAARALARPAGYYVPAGWTRIATLLELQGVRFERLSAAREVEVESLQVRGAAPAGRVYQGLVGMSATSVETRAATMRFEAGDLWIPGDQPLFALAANLLEPEAEDSLWAWGLLSSIVELKEWIGPAELEAEAARLLADPAIAAAWREALADPSFAADARARYRWWFERTPYFDATVDRLPVFRALHPSTR